MEVELPNIEGTGDGTILEVVRIADVRDAIQPPRLWIREWIDQRRYREVEVEDEFWALCHEPFALGTEVKERLEEEQ